VDGAVAQLRFDPARALEFASPLAVPTYGIKEAAHCLRMPVATLRDWLLGCSYSVKRGSERRRTAPLIDLADKKGRLLSFTNLAEAHVLGAFRRVHRVSLHNIRQALDVVVDKYGWVHPLVEQEFATDGLSMFIDHLGQLIDVSAQGQVVMRTMLDAHLKRLARNETGVFRLYPFTRPTPVDNPMSVFIDPAIAFGRPVLAAVRIPTASLAERYLAGETVEHLARDYDCQTLDIQEPLRVEWQLDSAA
jgi:uncharacterized protein (DUF433 family)